MCSNVQATVYGIFSNVYIYIILNVRIIKRYTRPETDRENRDVMSSRNY